MEWIILQKWSHVLFMHFEVDQELLSSLLPTKLELDSHQGRAFVSIVPFYMSHIRFPYTPRVPFASLWELNLRTYVKYKNQQGIYFFTLDANDKIGQLIANRFFHLPYRYKKMNGKVDGNEYFFKNSQITISSKIGSKKDDSDLSKWLSERYSLFTVNPKDELYRGDVIHDPWELYQLDELKYEDNFSKEFGFDVDNPILTSYSKGLDVRFKPFIKLS